MPAFQSGEHLVALAGVGPDAERAADVVEQDRGLAGRRRPAPPLRPAADGSARRRTTAPAPQPGEALAERGAGRRAPAAARYGCGGCQGWDLGAGVADALEAAVAGADVRCQHLGDAGALREVGTADDAFAGQHRAVAAARRHRRRAADELGLADVLHRLGPAGAIERAALDEDRALDLVPAARGPPAAPAAGSGCSESPTGDGADRRSAGPVRGSPRPHSPP